MGRSAVERSKIEMASGGSGGGESYEAEQIPDVPTVARTLGLRAKTRASVTLPDTVMITSCGQSHSKIGPGRSLH